MPVETTFYSTNVSTVGVVEGDFVSEVTSPEADFTFTHTCALSSLLNSVGAFKIALPATDAVDTVDDSVQDMTGGAAHLDNAATPVYNAGIEARAFRASLILALADDGNTHFAGDRSSDFKLALDELFAGLTAADQSDDKALQLSTSAIQSWLGAEGVANPLTTGGAFNRDGGATTADGAGFLWEDASNQSLDGTGDSAVSVFNNLQCQDILDGIRLGGRYTRAETKTDSVVALQTNDQIRIPIDIRTSADETSPGEYDNVIRVNLFLKENGLVYNA
jgi:hypothetical protein